jgi:HEAT repeat protein
VPAASARVHRARRRAYHKLRVRSRRPLPSASLEKYDEDVLASALAELRDPRMLEPMLALLGNRSQPDRQRYLAVGVLEALADARCVLPLRVILLDASESDVLRKVVAGALLKVAPDDARELFERLLFDPGISEDMRRSMASLLSELSDPRSLPTLLEALDTTQDDVLLGKLCRMISELGDKSHLPALKRAHERAGEDARLSCELAIDALREK